MGWLRRGLAATWAVALVAALLAGPQAGGAIADSPPALTSAQAAMQVGLRNSDDVGLRVDLRAELSVDGTLVAAGELPSVPTGSSGFNNSRRNVVTMGLSARDPLIGPSVYTLGLWTRNACSGSRKNSGSIRLWLNDISAFTGVEIVIGADGHFALLADNGSFRPSANGRRWIDVAVGAK